MKIAGVTFQERKVFVDDRGKVLHMLKSTDKEYNGFGEIYFSITNPNIVKGWKKHNISKQVFCVPFGELKVVIFDSREDSKSFGRIEEFVLSPRNHGVLTIPNNVWYSFKCLSKEPSTLVNCASIPHDPFESETLEIDSSRIPYVWDF